MDYAEVYSELHAENQLTFAGATCVQYADRIAKLVGGVSGGRLLDYGSGKGAQYLRHRIHEKWGGQLPDCYDPGVPYLSKRPKQGYRGIICCDVLEHIAEEDVTAVLDDIFGLLDPTLPTFVFLSISCRPSKHRRLRDGRNVHLTVQPPTWWNERIFKYADGGRLIDVVYEGESE